MILKILRRFIKKWTSERYIFFSAGFYHQMIYFDLGKILCNRYEIIMTVDKNIKNEKLQYDINMGAAIRLASSSGKIHEYEYLEQVKNHYLLVQVK